MSENQKEEMKKPDEEKTKEELIEEVKKLRSEIDKLNAKKQSLNNVTVFGKGAKEEAHALDRRIQHHEEDC